MLVILQLCLFVLQAQSMPSGAPIEACSNVYPTGHGGISQDLQQNPFSLHISAVFDVLGGTLYYVPEQTYESELIIIMNETQYFHSCC